MAVHAQTNRWPWYGALVRSSLLQPAACLDRLTLDSPAACIHAYACTAVTSEEAAWRQWWPAAALVQAGRSISIRLQLQLACMQCKQSPAPAAGMPAAYIPCTNAHANEHVRGGWLWIYICDDSAFSNGVERPVKCESDGGKRCVLVFTHQTQPAPGPGPTGTANSIN